MDRGKKSLTEVENKMKEDQKGENRGEGDTKEIKEKMKNSCLEMQTEIFRSTAA